VTVKPGWHGRYFEDFEIGDVYQHPLGRSITEADNTWFSLLTMNTNQIHFNNDFSARTPFGKILVNSGLTVAIVLGQSVTDISQTAIANLGWDDVRLPNPVFVGDTIYAESQVLDKRESKSRPYAGIVTCATRGLNQDGKTCVSWRRTIMVYRRDAPHDKDYFPVAVDGSFPAPAMEA
jgi:acyl dehydratase